MITGFPSYTASLTDDEKIIAEVLATSLGKQVGKDNAVTNKWISQKCQQWFMAKYKKKISLPGARMRKIIHHVRMTSLPNLCATENGYYVARDGSELLSYLDSLRQRIGAQAAIFNAGERYFNQLNGKQNS